MTRRATRAVGHQGLSSLMKVVIGIVTHFLIGEDVDIGHPSQDFKHLFSLAS